MAKFNVMLICCSNDGGVEDALKLEYELRRNYLLIGIGVSVAPETSGSPGFRRAAKTIHWPVRDQRLNRKEGQLLNRRGGTSLAKTIYVGVPYQG